MQISPKNNAIIKYNVWKIIILFLYLKYYKFRQYYTPLLYNYYIHIFSTENLLNIIFCWVVKYNIEMKTINITIDYIM